MILKESQRTDLAALLSRIGRENLLSLATHLGFTEIKVDLNESMGNLAKRIVVAIDDRDRLNPALTWLRQGQVDPYFEVQLRDVLAGRSIDDASKQKLRNTYEPFFSVLGVTELLPRVGRTVCAIGTTREGLVGSGFLIAPDLVMTNFHVLELSLQPAAAPEVAAPSTAPQAAPTETAERWAERIRGGDIYCFFDYHAPPEPNIPPSQWALENTVCVNAADAGWLVYARRGVSPEGTNDLPKEDCKQYDCVVFKLASPIGKSAVRNAGNRRRGWLTLPDKLSVLQPEGQKLLVFQHPEKSFQSLDVGDYKKLHPSTTRVWYAVNTAHGSSGGAAVDSKGQLFALHNAAVTDPGVDGLNQGVRIDLIGQDLRACVPKIDLSETNVDEDRFPWSMSDDVAAPEPIIGRTRFMELVGRVATSKNERALVVVGPPSSGVRFSAKLLRRVLGPQVRTVEFNASELQSKPPREFLQALLFKLGVVPPVDTAPPPKETENMSTWMRLDLPKWLVNRLTESEATPFDPRTPAAPSWVVINAVMPTKATTLWADHLKDFLAVLAGMKDSGQHSIDVSQLRWLFLGNSADDLPVRAGQQQDEDLGKFTDYYQKDFVDCINRAWLTLDKYEIPTEAALLVIAEMVRDNGGAVPFRQALSNAARSVILKKREKVRV